MIREEEDRARAEVLAAIGHLERETCPICGSAVVGFEESKEFHLNDTTTTTTVYECKGCFLTQRTVVESDWSSAEWRAEASFLEHWSGVL